MLNQLVHALVNSKNQAADDVLAEALKIGSDAEKGVALAALLRRHTTRGLAGVVANYGGLPEAQQITVLDNVKMFHAALRDSCHSGDTAQKMAAMKLIAMGRQGKLTYLLTEFLHSGDEDLAKAAVEAIGALARWIANETRKLQRNAVVVAEGEGSEVDGFAVDPRAAEIYKQIIEERSDIEAAVARALDVSRGPHGQDILRAALLLADSPGSKTLAILHTAKHGGQSMMLRRLQQPPDAEHVESFLLAATHGGLRSHFGLVFSHVEGAPVLDAVLRKTHWLKDNNLQLCMRQVTRGVWWGDAELERDLTRRDPADAGKIGEWIAASGVHDVVQDERMQKLYEHAKPSFEARLALLRTAMKRPRGSSVQLIKTALLDSDERLMRLAAREMVRRRPGDFENVLLQMMTNAPVSVRKVITRSVGQSGFEQFWVRFDRLDKSTRRAAGKAMLKLLPDGVGRLAKRLTTGPIAQQMKAIQMTQELGAIDALESTLAELCNHENAKVRSKAISALRDSATLPSAMLMDRVLADSDSRVRANAIEVLEQKKNTDYVPLLIERARSAQNRERANAIKALHHVKVGTAGPAVGAMLEDTRSEHRISGLWALKQIGWWKLLNQVAVMAKADPNLRVRRYALGLLRDVAETLRAPDKKAG